ncbi:MAG: flagellar assembly protein FliH [Nitrosomonadales bacterium]|nr:flagellar assembly protein FliH [Nitrosomonadales bacterium]
MSDLATPKERLTAYQRWELPAFDAAGARNGSAAAPMPTAAELEQARRQAHEAGYREGYAEGGQRAAKEAQRMSQMLDALNLELQRIDQQVVQGLLDLSLEISRQVLQQALKVKPELLLDVVRRAVSELPLFNQHAHLVLHPDDAELVRARMGEQLGHTGWKIIEDDQMERGGCRLETAHSQIDATLATRWQRVAASVGQDSTWLAP